MKTSISNYVYLPNLGLMKCEALIDDISIYFHASSVKVRNRNKLHRFSKSFSKYS
jgi:hypothetical protein